MITHSKYFHLPEIPPNFVGRSEELEEAIELIQKKRVAALLIWGEGGVGKTSLALKIADTLARKGDFHAIVWTSAKSADIKPLYRSIRLKARYNDKKYMNFFVEDINSLCRTILLASGFEDENYSEQLYEIFESENLLRDQTLNWLSKKRVLLVIDDLDGWKEWRYLFNFLNRVHFPSQVVITSRVLFQVGYLQGLASIKLKPFDREKSNRLITIMSNEHNIKLSSQDKAAIAEQAKGKPLIISLILGLISQRVKYFGVQLKAVSSVLDDTFKVVASNQNLGDFLYGDITSHLSTNALNVLGVIVAIYYRDGNVLFSVLKSEMGETASSKLNAALEELKSSSIITYADNRKSNIEIHDLAAKFVAENYAQKVRNLSI